MNKSSKSIFEDSMRDFAIAMIFNGFPWHMKENFLGSYIAL